MKSHHWINRPLSLFIAALITLSFSQLSHANEIKPGDNKPMPNIRWQDSDEKTHQLKDSDGQPRILHFWAAWCFPCRKELPYMLEWIQKNSDVLVIPLSLDERMAQSKYFIKKYNLDMQPLLINEDDSDALNIPALPYSIFVTADGSYSGYFYGPAPWEDDKFLDQVRAHFKLD
ncbi:MAG: redoxin domain-containing protein [Gammaproteobacteria bacterium]|nr:redoxin domain-containing protein [Gammaproteobacteria bacterium]MCW8922543.1 redoxin domain-containing protein [Gammaproteobacteria bacterium]